VSFLRGMSSQSSRHGVQNAAIDMLCGGEYSSATASISRREQPAALAGRVGSGRKRKLAVQPKSDTGNACRLDRFLCELYAVGKLLRCKRQEGGCCLIIFPFVCMFCRLFYQLALFTMILRSSSQW
jgi:hypothetical protein